MIYIELYNNKYIFKGHIGGEKAGLRAATINALWNKALSNGLLQSVGYIFLFI